MASTEQEDRELLAKFRRLLDWDGSPNEDKPDVVEKDADLVAAKDLILEDLFMQNCFEPVLDIGSAGGWAVGKLCRYLKPNNVTAVVINGDEARALLASGLRCDIHVGDMHCLPADWTNRFGAVRASHVIEHSPAPTLALAEIARVLQLGGLLEVTMPNRDGYVHLGGPRVKRLGDMPFHHYLPDCETFIEALRRAGLRFAGYWEVPQRSQERVCYWHRVWHARKEDPWAVS